MKNKNSTLYESTRKGRSFLCEIAVGNKPFLLLVAVFFLLLPLTHASHFADNLTESEKKENPLFADDFEIQKDEKGKFITIYNSPFLAETENVIASKLMNNKKVKDIIVSKSDKTITIYFSKDLSDAEINNFARIYFNK